MRLIQRINKRIGLLFIVLFIIILSAFILLSQGTEKDAKPPEINYITGNITAKAGETITIEVNFTDNVKVTNATLFYRTEEETIWKSTSIISKTKDLYIPPDTNKNWEYFITVDDALNNGPVGKPSTDGSKYFSIIILENTTNNDEWDETRYILVEEGTAGWCSNCPDVASIVHKIHEQNEIPFYYVSMIDDKNEKASNRLNDELNIYGFPTVYIDGGYTLTVGAGSFESKFKQQLSDAQARSTPKILINLTFKWDETKKQLENTVIVENKDDAAYSGTIKIYITEINSRWTDYNAEAYTYGFIDYGLIKDITLQSGERKTFSETWDAENAGFSDVVKENLFVIAAVFTSSSEKRYANPDTGEYPFDAYFCDAATGLRVSEGILPPTIGIKTPREYTHYLFGREKHNTFIPFTYVIGKLSLQVTITGGSDIEKVEYIVKGPFRSYNSTVTQTPYEWTWNKFSFGKYTITATVYDSNGQTNTDSIEVFAFIL